MFKHGFEAYFIAYSWGMLPFPSCSIAKIGRNGFELF